MHTHTLWPLPPTHPTPPTHPPTHPQALSITAGVYWLVGICAYSTFRQRTAGDVLRNFGGADSMGMRGAYERAIKACFGLAVLGSIPLVIIPFYTIVQPLLQGKGNSGGSSCCGAGSAGSGSAARRGQGYKLRQSSGETGGGGGGGADSSSVDILGARTAAPRTSALIRAKDSNASAIAVDDDVHTAGGAGMMVAPSVPQIIDPSFDPHISAHDAEVALSFPQHALLTFCLLGTGMAAALWLPNLEFIFGLTGATTSVFISYIMPALCFLKLAGPDPEVAFGAFGGSASKPGGAGGAAAGGGAKPGLLAPVELRASWKWRRRIAKGLLAFGVIAGVLCTHAILSSIREEKAVVQLAQELVAHEVVVAEAAHAQIKAKEAAAAISAVQVRAGRGGCGFL